MRYIAAKKLYLYSLNFKDDEKSIICAVRTMCVVYYRR